MNIQKIKAELLIPATYNPRKDLKPGDAEYEKIKNSIIEFGYVEPIIINKDYTIIGGHQRYKVLIDLGYKEIECIIVDIDKTKEKALNIALNKISGEWDNDKLEQLLAELKTEDIDLSLTGFSFDEIDTILKDITGSKEDDFDIDQALNEIEEPVSKYGDVWLLGRHRLMCGDSTKEDDVNIFRALDKLNNKYKALIIWNKGNHTLSNSNYMSKYEPIVYGWFNSHLFYGNRSNFDIWDIERTKKNDLHPTMKPVDLVVEAIKNSSKEEDIILDLFGGSGTTLVASEEMNRTCYMMELDPKYCDVIIKRWETLTGKKAKLEM